MEEELKKDSLEYHDGTKKGKLEVLPLKPLNNQRDLSLAYSPGVAYPCLEIQKNPLKAFDFTSKSNVVAVITDGSAVLGLGNIGAKASVPVMEGKSVLFKKFADIDSFPLAVDKCRNAEGKTDIEKFVSVVETLEPVFGGINLEDIAAPACFEIEERLEKSMGIPVFHDDQHGTAIITLAALQNSLELAEKKINEVKIVINGFGAAGRSIAKIYLEAGAKKENLFCLDSHGIIFKGRKEGMNKYKEEFAFNKSEGSLKDAVKEADVFVGVSAGNVLSKEMVQSMNEKAVVFALANPFPEIEPKLALEAGAFIVGTGRSDYSNQINNLLGYPGIFRGALDTRSTQINEEMKLAASNALRDLLKEEIPEEVKKKLYEAYPSAKKEKLFEGKNPLSVNLVIPKVLDERVVPRVARAVAEAAMKSKASLQKIDDLKAYEKKVKERISFIENKIGRCSGWE